jgi:hypothetical protein
MQIYTKGHIWRHTPTLHIYMPVNVCVLVCLSKWLWMFVFCLFGWLGVGECVWCLSGTNCSKWNTLTRSSDMLIGFVWGSGGVTASHISHLSGCWLLSLDLFQWLLKVVHHVRNRVPFGTQTGSLCQSQLLDSVHQGDSHYSTHSHYSVHWLKWLYTVPSESIQTHWPFPNVVLQPAFKMYSIEILCHWPTHNTPNNVNNVKVELIELLW